MKKLDNESQILDNVTTTIVEDNRPLTPTNANRENLDSR